MRICDECARPMSEGYCINGGEEYYCTDACLHKNLSPKNYEELFNDGEGDSYWTQWED